MEGVNIKKIEPVHTDERGEIFDLTNEKIHHIGILTCKKNSIRGNHYFKTSKRFVYVLDGKFQVALANSTSPKKIELVEIEKGTMIEIEAGIIHAFKAIEDSVLLGFDTKSRANGGYETEVVRVIILK